jgi:membrane protein implicated in regulation of membrane protease activity
MELISGIVLAVVVLAIAVYLIKELFGDKLGAVVTEYKQKPVRSPNHHLVGSVGTVISVPRGEEEFLRVRIGIERWNARASADQPLSMGATVRVTAVDGLVLHVEEKAPDAIKEQKQEVTATSDAAAAIAATVADRAAAGEAADARAAAAAPGTNPPARTQSSERAAEDTEATAPQPRTP